MESNGTEHRIKKKQNYFHIRELFEYIFERMRNTYTTFTATLCFIFFCIIFSPFSKLNCMMSFNYSADYFCEIEKYTVIQATALPFALFSSCFSSFCPLFRLFLVIFIFLLLQNVFSVLCVC